MEAAVNLGRSFNRNSRSSGFYCGDLPLYAGSSALGCSGVGDRSLARGFHSGLEGSKSSKENLVLCRPNLTACGYHWLRRHSVDSAIGILSKSHLCREHEGNIGADW